MAQRRVIGKSAWILGAAGLAIGVIASLLVKAGNPGNMGLCIACFLRDIEGFFFGSITGQGAVAYIRPEILGIIFGALGAAFITKEFKPRGGSMALVRFVLGIIFMLGALVFLGCTVRAWLRLGGGDLSALWGIAGIFAGVLIGIIFLKRGFNLGAALNYTSSGKKILGWIIPALAVVALIFAVMAAGGTIPGFATQTKANALATGDKPPVVFLKDKATSAITILKPEGAKVASDGSVTDATGKTLASADSMANAKPQPGGKRALLIVSLLGGLVIGVIAQRSRFCSIGGIRDAFLVKRYDLLFGVLGLVIGSAIMNIILGQFNLGFTGQPVAHNDALGSFVAMTIATLAAMFLGGCPFRQVIMGSEGDTDAGSAVAGMLVGAFIAHFFGLASSGKGLAPNAWPMMAVLAVILLVIGLVFSRKNA